MEMPSCASGSGQELVIVFRSFVLLTCVFAGSAACQGSSSEPDDALCSQAYEHVVALELGATTVQSSTSAAHEAALRRAMPSASKACRESEARCILASDDLAAARSCATTNTVSAESNR